MSAEGLELQILELAGQGAAAEEIAQELNLELPAVEFALRRHGMINEDEISNEDFEAIRTGLIDLAKYSRNEFVKAKVGIFLYERKKGATKDLKGAPSVNIGNLNLLIAASHQKVLKALSIGENDYAGGSTSGGNGGGPKGVTSLAQRPPPGQIRTATECQTLPEETGVKP